MKEFSVLFGGKAGDGIDRASLLMGRILSRLGYRIYIYRDYPSIIRGGHTFSIIRASLNKVTSHLNKVDFMLAMNQETVALHRGRLKKDCFFIYDSEQVKVKEDTVCGKGLSLAKILKEENAPVLMRNSCLIGALCKATGIEWEVLEEVFRREIPRELELNIKVARRGYDETAQMVKLQPLSQAPLPVLTGNEALGLGLARAGLDAYIAYPMTPSSGILHFLAAIAADFSLKVIHPESEIGAILMALGLSYAGKKVAVGTSGGGFCLMTEGLSFAAMAELPLVIIVGQRPGPSTGLPTYTSQTELHFVLHAGQGEFPRFIIAPADAEEACFSSTLALNIALKYQIPSIILTDKTIAEGTYSFDIGAVEAAPEIHLPLWDRKAPYKRYLNTEDGVSPLAFVPDKEAVIKVNSYEHDEYGITTEDAGVTVMMQDKRLRKEKYLREELKQYRLIRTYGRADASTAILCWGSNKGVCVEAAQNLGLKVIHPLVLWPFPEHELKKSLVGVKKIICVENNATGQLQRLIKPLGFSVDETILRYDGRPFSVDELSDKLIKVIRG